MSQRKVISSPKSCYESVERDVTDWYVYLSYRLTHFQFESLGKRLTASDYVLKTLFKYSSSVVLSIDSVFCIVQITSPSLSTAYQGVGKPLYWQKLSPHHLKTGTEPIREGKYLIIWEVQIYEMDSNL